MMKYFTFEFGGSTYSVQVSNILAFFGTENKTTLIFKMPFTVQGKEREEISIAMPYKMAKGEINA